NTGSAVGEHGTIVRTTDGGATWMLQPSGTGAHLTGVSFTDANTGTVVGYDGTILRTVDGGASWVAQSSGTTNRLSVGFFTDADRGSGVGDHGTILRTTDGGATWKAHQLSVTGADGTTSLTFTGVSFANAYVGVVVGGFFEAYPYNFVNLIGRTSDGGETWTQ